jgi:hypothetical protein
VNSHAVDEVSLPPDVGPQELVQFSRIVEQLISGEVLGETAVVIRAQLLELEAQSHGYNQEDKDLPLHQ